RHLRIVDADRTVAVGSDADRLEPEIGGIGCAAGTAQEEIGIDGLAGRKRAANAVAPLLDRGEQHAAADANAARPVHRHQMVTHVLVESAQELVGADQHLDLDSGHMEDAGELDRDVAAPGYDDTSRQGFEVERLVRGDEVLGTGNIGHGRPAAGRDHDALGCHLFGADAHSVRILQHAAAAEHCDAGLFEQGDVDAVEPVELLVLGGDELRPVEAALADLPAIAGGILELLGEMRAIDQELFRDAAAQHAGAADAARLDDGHPGAVSGGAPAACNAARPGADGEEIEIVFRHASPDLPFARQDYRIGGFLPTSPIPRPHSA